MSFGIKDINGRVALVTGAASGIGRATALALADAGARLVICDVKESALNELAQTLEAQQRLLFAQRTDVANRAAMQAFADEVHARTEAVDILINNAGVGLSGGLLTTSFEDWDWVLSINLGGVVNGCKLFVPKMVARKLGGHVVNVASALGLAADGDLIGYSTAKFGVVGLSESLRSELYPHRIGVSTICPGLINTDIVGATRFRTKDGHDPDKVRARASQLYNQRNYPPEKVATAILSAIRRDRAVVPVTPEAWLAYYMKRAVPQIMAPIGRAIRRRTFDKL